MITLSRKATLEAERYLTADGPTRRWASVGPYYAMFPVPFAFDVVDKYSVRGESVLDPFAGRGTAVFAAATLGRQAAGIEISPVGWLYGHVKLQPAPRAKVLDRLSDICRHENENTKELRELPTFFHAAYSTDVLRFLLRARSELDWQRDRVDATLMVFLLLYLHGKAGAALSNQMRDGKAMAPDYAVRWWADRSMLPPDVKIEPFIKQRIEWRYTKGIPWLPHGEMVLGNSRTALATLEADVRAKRRKRIDLLFTSPPYYGVTNYHYDQWLRLWLLGGESHPRWISGDSQNRFNSQPEYRNLLEEVFGQAARLLKKGAIIYVRTDAREFTLETTRSVLLDVFDGKKLRSIKRPYIKKTQTALFGDSESKPGEVDLILK